MMRAPAREEWTHTRRASTAQRAGGWHPERPPSEHTQRMPACPSHPSCPSPPPHTHPTALPRRLVPPPHTHTPLSAFLPPPLPPPLPLHCTPNTAAAAFPLTTTCAPLAPPHSSMYSNHKHTPLTAPAAQPRRCARPTMLPSHAPLPPSLPAHHTCPHQSLPPTHTSARSTTHTLTHTQWRHASLVLQPL